ncbi:ABC transporter permease [Paraglaciecola arctica]|uniref:ABC transporter permease n=1 Tax=Paraglaciecola arctica TaxID=1128911 RepID=UPI001C072883|nr:ABC transporter permease [Paraglaciecola arctica]MBU3004585.1 ABC transporter permease [Paraglaciecola arctica]
MSQSLYLLKQAWASLKTTPGFVTAVVTTISVTFGALLCVLTLAYLLLVSPLSYPESDNLYTVEHNLVDNNAGIDGTAFTYPNLMQLYAKQTAFSDLALMYYDADVLISQPSHPTLSISFVTPEWFLLLGAEMALGRSFTATEALNSYNLVAILSYQTWKNDFSLDSDILSKKVQFGDVSYRVVGVLDEKFVEPQIYGVGYKSQVFLPWDYNSISASERKKWGNDDSGLMTLGRLKPGNSIAQTEQQLTSLVSDNWQQQVAGHQFFNGWSIGIKLHTLKSVILANSQQTVYLLIAAVIGLVLIATTNIANLFMSRTVERSRQIAIRAAIGASRRQVFHMLLAEAALLVGVATVIAMYIASLGFKGMQMFLNQYLPRIDELSLHFNTIVYALILIVGFAWFFAYICMRMIDFQSLNQSMQTGGKGIGKQVSKKVRQGLVFAQISIVTLLVFINIVLFSEAMTTINRPSGFATKNISFLVLSLPRVDESERDGLVANMAEVRDKLAALPQVDNVSQSMAPMPFFSLALSRLGGDERYSIRAKDVDHSYFQLIEQPLLAGNYFSEADIKDSNNVMIVNDVFAKELAPNGNALGLTFDNGAKIVGVVKGILIPGDTTIEPRFYFPASPTRNMFLINTQEGQSVTREQVVQVLSQVSKELKLFSLSTLEGRRVERLFSQYTTAVTSGALAILTFLLAGIGLYGILSYSTQMRRFEIGTRLAIGAKRSDVIKLIIKDNSSMILLGMLSGVLVLLALYLGFNQVLTVYLSENLILAFVLTVTPILFLSIFACYWPLRRFINQPAVNSLRGSD